MVIAPSRTVQPPWLPVVVDILLLVLPGLATVALYLPSGPLMPARLTIMALVVLAVWQTLVLGRRAITPVVVGALAVFGLMLLFGLIGVLRFEGGSIAALVQFSYVGAACVALAVLGRRRRAILALLVGWAASAVVAGIVGFWEILTARHLPGNAPAQQWADVIPGWNVISSFFDNPNLYAYHCVVVLLVLPALYQHASRAWRTGIVALGLAVAVLLYWTSGRMAMLALALGLTLWALTRAWSRWALLGGVVLILGTMAAGLAPGRTIYASAHQLIENLQWGELTSSGSRLQLIKAGWWMAEQSGFLGTGAGSFPAWAKNPDNPHVAELSNPHFGLVEILAEYGLVSLIVFVAALVVVAVFALRRVLILRSETSARPTQALTMAVFVLAVTAPLLSATHSTWLVQPLTAVHLATIAGLVACVAARGPFEGHRADGAVESDGGEAA